MQENKLMGNIRVVMHFHFILRGSEREWRKGGRVGHDELDKLPFCVEP